MITRISVVYATIPFIILERDNVINAAGNDKQEIDFNELGAFVTILEQQQAALGKTVDFEKGIYAFNNKEFPAIVISASDTPSTLFDVYNNSKSSLYISNDGVLTALYPGQTAQVDKATLQGFYTNPLIEGVRATGNVGGNLGDGMRLIYFEDVTQIQTLSNRPYTGEVLAPPVNATSLEITDDVAAMAFVLSDDGVGGTSKISIAGMPQNLAGMQATTDGINLLISRADTGAIAYAATYLNATLAAITRANGNVTIDTGIAGAFTIGVEYNVVLMFVNTVFAGNIGDVVETFTRLSVAVEEGGGGGGNAFAVIGSNDLGTHCVQGTIIAYKSTVGDIVPGDQFFQDVDMTVELSGYTFISIVSQGNIYAIDNVTGVVGADTGNSC